jgi:shikimate dehydrogenase
MEMSGKTTVCGLIGDPVAHSMSPAMQNAAFRRLDLDYAYVPFRVESSELGHAISAVRALHIRGLNVTIPHKLAVMPLLDRLDDLATRIGAVNTIVNDGGLLTGYNTDAPGFLQPLRQRRFEPSGKRVLILGSGGAARAVAFALMDGGATLTILNRTANRARELAAQLSSQFGGQVTGGLLDNQNLAAGVGGADLVVNTTSVGMGGVSSGTPLPSELLRPGLVVYDIVYNPVRTRLLREAETAGCVTVSGIDMLAWQGALAFERWTGRSAPVDLMREEIIRHLNDEN